jgi:hypothetical protein
LLLFMLFLVAVGEAASDGNPAAMTLAALLMALPLGVITALLFGGLRGPVKHYHLHYHGAPPELPQVRVGKPYVAQGQDVRLLE